MRDFWVEEDISYVVHNDVAVIVLITVCSLNIVPGIKIASGTICRVKQKGHCTISPMYSKSTCISF